MRGLSYASGSFGKALIVGALELTGLIYLTEMIGVSPGTAGTVLFATQLIAAGFDPIVGRAVDRCAFRPYRAGPFLAMGAVVSATAFVALYALPLLMVRDLALAIVLVLTVRLGISLLEVPYNALLPQISLQSQARTSIAIWKFGFSTLAVLVLSAIIDLVLAHAGARSSPSQVFVFGALCGMVGPGSVLLAWWRVRHSDRIALDERRRGISGHSGSLPSFRALWHREYALLFVVLILTPFTTQLFIKSLAYRATYLMGDPGAARDLLIALMVGQVPGLLLWDRLAASMGAARGSALAFALTALGFVFLAVASSAFGAVLATIVIGLGAAGALSMVWALAADCADRARVRSGHDQGSTAFGLLTFAGKLGSAMATLGLGWALSFAGLEKGLLAATQVMQAVALLNSCLPALVAGLCCWVLLAYDRVGTKVSTGKSVV